MISIALALWSTEKIPQSFNSSQLGWYTVAMLGKRCLSRKSAVSFLTLHLQSSICTVNYKKVLPTYKPLLLETGALSHRPGTKWLLHWRLWVYQVPPTLKYLRIHSADWSSKQIFKTHDSFPHFRKEEVTILTTTKRYLNYGTM